MTKTTSPRSRSHDDGVLVVNIRALGRRPGSLLPVRRSVPAPGGMGLELIEVPAGEELDLDLRVESVMEGVLVSGTVTAPLTGQCSRCLEPMRETVAVQLTELFAYPDSATSQTTDEDEVSRLTGDTIDLEPLVRDAVVLGLPLAPVCDPECAGLCAGCGLRLDDLPDGHEHTDVDPRWAALAGFVPEPEPPTD